MTLGPLATSTDLTKRSITLPVGMDSDTALAAATDAVRDAAGCPISLATSTVTLVVSEPDWIDLPGGPVVSIASVTCGATALTWTKVGDSVRIDCSSWPVGTQWPVEVSVTYTHGLAVVPVDIVDLVCQMVAIAGNQDGDPGNGGKLSSVRLDQYSESYIYPAGTESPSPYSVPQRVRDALRARFGTSVAVVGVRR